MRSVRLLSGIVLVLVSLGFRADCLPLDFHAQLGVDGLDLTCSVSNLTLTSISHLDSLLIYKTDGSTRHLLASVSAHNQQNGLVSHVSDAQVTGQLSNDDIYQRYLRILWAHSEPGLDGEYTCELHGEDADYEPAFVAQGLTVKVKSLCPCFWASPEVLQVGLTKEFEVMCSILDPPAANISKLASLEIISVFGGIREILAEINSQTGVAAITSPGDRISVNGSIDGQNTFLKVVWEYPSEGIASQFECEGSGVGTNGEPVFFSRWVNVTFVNPDPRELVQRLFEMYDEQKDYHRCLEDLDKLTNTKKPDTTLYTTSHTTLEYRTTPTILRPQRCEDVNLQGGELVVTVEPGDGLGPLQVLCRNFGPGDAWTVFQKRFNGSVEFYRNFSEYKNGFGSVYGEFWLGLQNIRRLLLQNGNNQLGVDLKEFKSNMTYTKTYPNFSLGPEDAYQLNISGGVIDSGNGISLDIGQNFSTYDRGYTWIADSTNRAAGWWFPENGGFVNINGKWGVMTGAQSMTWYEFEMLWDNPMRETQMMFRLNRS